MQINKMKKEITMLITYNFIGLINTAIDFCLFFILTKWLFISITISQIFSYSVGMINSYFMNRKLTFKSNKTINIVEFISFLSINVISLTISTIVLNTMVSVTDSLLISKIIATIFSMGINYVGQRFITFRKRGNNCE